MVEEMSSVYNAVLLRDCSQIDKSILEEGVPSLSLLQEKGRTGRSFKKKSIGGKRMHRGMKTGLIVSGFLAMVTGCVTQSGPFAVLPMTSPAAAHHNLEGIQQYNAGKWKEAKSRFESAIQADHNLPEAHFNLALAFHKLGNHQEATIHFKRARELAPTNKEVVESSAYRNHLGLSSTLEKHLSGGYRY